MIPNWCSRAVAVLAVALLPVAGAPAQVANREQQDRVISHHAMRGTLIGFEVADYVHAVIRDGSKERSFFLGEPGLDYYLALHQGEMLDLGYEVVDAFIEQAAGVVRLERLVSATDGRLGARDWWLAELGARSVEELSAKYDPLIDRYTISVYPTPTVRTPSALEGKWRITGKNHCPHICAMDAAEAARWQGVVLTYSRSVFSDGRHTCSSPKFTRRGLTAKSFLAEYRFKAEAIGLEAPVIEEFSVQCDNGRAGGPGFGATALVRDTSTLIVPWDGVYFEARRE